MKTYKLWAIALFVCSVLPCSSAHAGAVLGMQCRFLGDTSVTNDRESLAVCLKEKDANILVWKALSTEKTATKDEDSFCGFAAPVCTSICALNVLVNCKGQPPLKPIYSRQGNIDVVTGFTSNCPDGYELKSYLNFIATQPAAQAQAVQPQSAPPQLMPPTPDQGLSTQPQYAYFCVKS